MSSQKETTVFRVKTKIKNWQNNRNYKKNLKLEEIERKNLWFKKFLKDRGLEKYTKQLIAVKDWTIIIVHALLLATICKTFFYENFKIPSGSMNPLLLNGDRVLVNKWYYGYSKFSFPFDLAPIKERILSNRSPKRGDIVVFHTKFSEKNGIFYIKRVIGLPNDKIQIKKNQVYVNGEKMKYQKINTLEGESEFNHNNFAVTEYIENNNNKEYNILVGENFYSIAGNTREYIVPEEHYFCMGDNRDNSHDSRFPDFGFIPFRNIVGKAERIFFSTANGRFNFDRIFKNIQAN